MLWCWKRYPPFPQYQGGKCLPALPWWPAPAPLWRTPRNTRCVYRVMSPVSSDGCGKCRHSWSPWCPHGTWDWRRHATHQSPELRTLLRIFKMQYIEARAIYTWLCIKWNSYIDHVCWRMKKFVIWNFRASIIPKTFVSAPDTFLQLHFYFMLPRVNLEYE